MLEICFYVNEAFFFEKYIFAYSILFNEAYTGLNKNEPKKTIQSYPLWIINKVTDKYGTKPNIQRLK